MAESGRSPNPSKRSATANDSSLSPMNKSCFRNDEIAVSGSRKYCARRLLMDRGNGKDNIPPRRQREIRRGPLYVNN